MFWSVIRIWLYCVGFRRWLFLHRRKVEERRVKECPPTVQAVVTAKDNLL
jgi:hypothetical protein